MSRFLDRPRFFKRVQGIFSPSVEPTGHCGIAPLGLHRLRTLRRGCSNVSGGSRGTIFSCRFSRDSSNRAPLSKPQSGDCGSFHVFTAGRLVTLDFSTPCPRPACL